MPTQELTDKFIESKKRVPAEGQIDWFDTAIGGLSLRVTSRGARSWYLFYRLRGETKLRRDWLGTYPALTLSEARKKAGAMKDDARNGKDPKLELERERRESTEARAHTVKVVAKRYFVEIGAAEPETPTKRKGRKTKEPLRTAHDIKRDLDRFTIARFGERPIGDITRRELIALFDDIAHQNGPIMANRALAWTKRLFKWAASKDYIAANPAADIEKPGEERKGTRVLDDDEIREVWAAADVIGYPYGHYVKALLLTGRRRTSVARMARSEINRKARTWKPAGGTDNKQQPELPLFTAMETLLDSIPPLGERDRDADFIFRTGAADIPVSSFTAIKNEIDSAVAKARTEAGVKPMPDWDLSRDVRRTVKTRLAELQVPKEIRDLIIGHARQGMDAVYDHSERREEKRAALERWSRRLMAILDSNPNTWAACACSACSARLKDIAGAVANVVALPTQTAQR
jgi:hypothetical protein